MLHSDKDNKPWDLIRLFLRHRVAANLLMSVMILSGVWALLQLNTQFLPNFKLHVITVRVVWPGANAEDVEHSVTTPLEQELQNLDHLKKMTSVSRLGNSLVTLEFKQGTDMAYALEQVRDRVSQVRDLPTDAEQPIVQRQIRYENVAKLFVTIKGGGLQELRPLIYRMERELLDRGIAKVKITGLPEQEIAIQVPAAKLAELHLSLAQIARRVAQLSDDIPAGEVGRGDVKRQLRSLDQRRTVSGFERLPLFTDSEGQVLRLGDIATITRRPQERQVSIYYQGQPAVELSLLRTETASTLKSARILQEWLNEIRPQLGPHVRIHIFDESWQYIKQRINLLLKNGAGGFILILIILFLFLNGRVAFWVAVGIPVSFMAALAALYLFDGSINMVSLFALIMTLGIIVDDTIVVGEESLTQLTHGHDPLYACEVGAKKMMMPVLASSLTTVCAFLPLFLITGIMGTILSAIPLMAICVIIASLFEAFLVLPSHLYHGFKQHKQIVPHKLRAYLDERFVHFREHQFRPFATQAIKHHWLTLSIAAAISFMTFGLVLGGHLNFTFFPSPEAATLHANVTFNASTPPAKSHVFMMQLEKALEKTDKQLSEKAKPIVQTAAIYTNMTHTDDHKGEAYSSMLVELSQPDMRKVTNREFIENWRKNIALSPDVANFSIIATRAGPPGRDLAVRLSGDNIVRLKQASEALQLVLRKYQGVSDIEDDLPYGEEQLIYQLSPEGKTLGLSVEQVGRQLHAAFNGEIAQVFHESHEEIEVRVTLPDAERYSLNTLEQLPIVLPSGNTIPLDTVVELRARQGFDAPRHTNTKLTALVTAEVDNKVTNANKIIANLSEKALPELIRKYNVKVNFEGRAEEQEETLRDMRYGIFIAFALIYIILAWVFASYGWPLLVMVAVPLGLTGAILGHWVLGLDLTVLSLFGFFGLSGIVINDSIILLSRYKLLREMTSLSVDEAIIEAACQRLRAVLLTSITTIAGLLPLLFETSRQAQFLIPMAVSITFGLAFATFLILLVIPALLAIYERRVDARKQSRSPPPVDG